MTDDADAEILCELPHPEDIVLDDPKETDSSALILLLRWLRTEPTSRESRFQSYL